MGLNILSPAEQVAAHLRDEIANGRWKNQMPGIAHLKSILGVNHVTINAALRQLEQEGWLASQGRRRCRRIVRTPSRQDTRPMRFRLIPYDKENRAEPDCLAILDGLHKQGHLASFARKSLHELGMNPERVARFVAGVEADAWIVSGASREVFEWFARQDCPAIGLFGRFSDVPIAGVGVRKSPLLASLVRRLASLGHHRIVMLSHRERIVPNVALGERNFLAAMAGCGIPTSPFNLPEWEPSNAGLRRCIEGLFRHTPPTALIVAEPRHFIAIQNQLTTRGIRVGQDVSMICCDPDPSFRWCHPTVTHMQWETKKVVNHVVRWSNQVALGKKPVRQKLYDAFLVEGESIGPAPR
ncbi:substrate-binding domain-containing protein [Haloferula sp. A504]|uniref:substrate-binding domain-containing protein n=1 Tax=Haloferula sp. A504 TaxID=3373601 RepID=UPI0031C1BEBF|nr:substrate-binding domain-containing protein [Verrucomicrobiaceae bacterium E54]